MGDFLFFWIFGHSQAPRHGRTERCDFFSWWYSPTKWTLWTGRNGLKLRPNHCWKKNRKEKFFWQPTMNSLGNGFIGSAVSAYNLHHHLVLSPDQVWVAITTAFANFVDRHAEEMRHHFVSFFLTQNQKEALLFLCFYFFFCFYLEKSSFFDLSFLFLRFSFFKWNNRKDPKEFFLIL